MSKLTNILLAEDDDNLGLLLFNFLKNKGYGVSLVRNGKEAFETFNKEKFDFCIFDVMMPIMDGFTLAKEIREIDKKIPILFLTAKSMKEDKLEGFAIGADDYLTKPFVPKELSARIRALLRRARSTDNVPSRIVIDRLELIPDEGVVKVEDKEIHLTRTEFRLLVELAAQPGRVLSREDLLQKVWDYDYFGDGRLVDVHVRRLRTKIELDPANPRYVMTVRGMGYKLQP